MIAVFVNVLTVIVGSSIGLLINKGISKKITDAVMIGIGATTMYIGITGLIKGQNPLVAVISIVLGAIIGTLLKIDDSLNRLGSFLEKKLSKNQSGNLAKGFVSGSLLFCVGSMTVVGSLNAGLTGDCTMLYAKATLDFFSSMMLATSLGIGVTLAAVFVLIFQGGLVLLSGVISPLLNTAAINELTCVGSIVILLLAFNLMGLSKFKVADYMPAILFAPLISKLFELVEI